jgi:hypothetical protein
MFCPEGNMRNSTVNKHGVPTLICPDEQRLLQTVGAYSKLLTSFCARISTGVKDDVTDLLPG